MSRLRQVTPRTNSGMFAAMTARTLGALLLATLAVGAGACGAGSPDAVVTAARAGTCAPASGALVSPLPYQRSSSSLAMGRLSQGPAKGKLLAYVIDRDDGSIVLLDVAAKQALATFDAGKGISSLLLLPDGRLLATDLDSDRLRVLHPAEDGKLTQGCEIEVGSDPRAMAVSPAGDVLLVASGGQGQLAVFDLSANDKAANDKLLSQVKQLEIGRDPRAVLILENGKQAYVTHASAQPLDVIDLAARTRSPSIPLHYRQFEPEVALGPSSLQGRVRAALGSGATTELQPGDRIGAQGYALVETRGVAGRLLLPHVLVDAGDRQSPRDHYGGDDLRHAAMVNVIDVQARTLVRPPGSADFTSRLIEEDGFRGGGGRVGPGQCLLPRAAALDDKTASLLVACAGIDSLVVYDAHSVDPSSVERGRATVGMYPSGLVVDSAARRAYVWAEHERVLDIVDLDALVTDTGIKKREKLQLERSKAPLSLGTMLGRQIFHASGDVRIAADGVACASCHPDGGDDGLTWATKAGPRRTRSIALAGASGGFGWESKHQDVAAFAESEILQLGGKGLRGVQLEALLTYLGEVRRDPAPAPAAVMSVLAKHGCAECHESSKSGTFDVGTRTRFDRRGTFAAPVLLQLPGRAPYLHDGRFSSLSELLAAPHAPEGKKVTLSEADQKELLDALTSR